MELRGDPENPVQSEEQTFAMEPDEERDGEQFETLETIALHQGRQIFRATGYSTIKVAQRDEKPRFLRIPIQSHGVSELLERLERDAPQPPGVTKTILPKSDVGIELGLKQKAVMKIPDLSDTEYLRRANEHQRKTMIAALGIAITSKVIGEDGEELEGDEKVEALLANGLAGEHLRKIFEDVKALTEMEQEERERFSEAH